VLNQKGRNTYRLIVFNNLVNMSIFFNRRFRSLPLSRRRVLGLLTGSILVTSMVLPPLANSQQRDVELTLVSFAVTRAAYERIIPKFVAAWKKETGQTVRFRQSYGGSGSQTRAVIDGLEADIVNLAIPIDVIRLQQAGLIQPGWESRLPNNGIVARSVIALAVRPGNPKKINDWPDLARPGIRVITANPRTSGVARWNFLGLWGSVTENGGSEAQAEDYVGKVYRNVPILPRDAREATDVFLKQRQGDVLLNYENELILAAQQGQVTPYVVPSVNISIDMPLAIVDRNVDRRGTRRVAEAFARFLYTPAAQSEFARVGFRPILPAVERQFAQNFRPVRKLYSVSDLGGWSTVQSKFFADRALFDRILRSLGKR
jgi:sulfate transport system substrate-binding protein